MKYVVFKTQWGWFGLLACEQGLVRTLLPVSTRQVARDMLLEGRNNPEFDKALYKPLQDKIIAYFEGKTVDFNTARLASPQNPSPFTRSVLSACRKIPLGKTLTYSQLAAKIGRPKAVRAVANALADNPLPLIIPCHRVIRSDGQVGGFSAPGGKKLKTRLIKLEYSTLEDRKSV
jgi:O-6-methylguanine DNA methyltransferase